MRTLTAHLPEVFNRLSSQGAALFLDFDGTIAPFVPIPAHAALAPRARRALRKLVTMMPIVIVSGRPIAFISSRVRMSGVWYAGNHGLEWQIGKRHFNRPLPARSLRALVEAKRELRRLIRRYPGALIEDKRLSLSIHCRRINPARRTLFMREALSAAAPAVRRGRLSTTRSKYAIEFRSDTSWNKGSVARMLLARLRKESGRRLVPIYIGDEPSDEDAFRLLEGGVTIRVGKKAKSSAQYYLSDRRQVDAFLESLAVAWATMKT